jgi:hypothetical protein
LFDADLALRIRKRWPSERKFNFGGVDHGTKFVSGRFLVERSLLDDASGGLRDYKSA